MVLPNNLFILSKDFSVNNCSLIYLSMETPEVVHLFTSRITVFYDNDLLNTVMIIIIQFILNKLSVYITNYTSESTNINYSELV